MIPIFGYGSLILPTSLISRFEHIDPPLEEVYAGETESVVRPEAVERWEEWNDQLTYVPVKLWGFRRYYSLSSERGGTMLEVVRSDDPDDWINGVLVYGLPDNEKAQVVRSEAGYEYSTLQNPDLEYYIDPETLTSGLDRDPELQIFVSDKDPSEITATEPRNSIYHRRIIAGIRMLGEQYGPEFVDEFYEDFCETTYETADDDSDPASFNTVRRNDVLRGDVRWPAKP